MYLTYNDVPLSNYSLTHYLRKYLSTYLSLPRSGYFGVVVMALITSTKLSYVNPS